MARAAPTSPVMRLLAIAVVLSTGCISSTIRPAVIPKLSELPAESGRRDAVLDSGVTTAGPEQRRGMTKKQRAVESAAATAAAAIGLLFSKSSNVTLGGAGNFDENRLFEIHEQPRPENPEEKPEPPPVAVNPLELVPWVRLDPR